MKRKYMFILTAVIFLLGAGIFLYPDISNSYNQRHQSRVIEQHNEMVAEIPEEELEKEKELIRNYNQGLLESRVVLTDPFDENAIVYNGVSYHELLSEDEIMAYVEIPKIDVYLPIYHGTKKETLEKGIGHLEQTSLPLGGEGTHMVISGHTGLPSAMLFTDLVKLKEGDRFYIYVLDEKLSYKVEQISVVEPDDISNLLIEKDKDYVTMVTCTPYGVNTHRLLVRGIRTFDEEEQIESEKETYNRSGILGTFLDWLESRRVPVWLAIVVAFGILAAFAIVLLSNRGKKHEKDN